VETLTVHIKQHLAATGDYARLLAETRAILRDVGWRDAFLKRIMEAAQHGDSTRRVEDLLNLLPGGTESVPEEVRQAMVARLLDLLNS